LRFTHSQWLIALATAPRVHGIWGARTAQERYEAARNKPYQLAYLMKLI
jgi:hypothetical protein